tara:strand:- start:477 stop:1211 length:735 start_codon:yes stop_codon:yes gene_type:complete
MIEEKVIQNESVANSEQSVAVDDNKVQPTSIPAVDYQVKFEESENQRQAEKEARLKAEKGFSELKAKVDEMYKKADEKRVKNLEDQGQWKTLWEEANKTNQEKEQKIANLSQQLEDMKTSNELASTKTKALAAISNLGAINAEQTLSLLQNKLQKNSEGKVVVLNGGVEQDLNSYLSSLKNPGSGWEHHFKPSSAAGMGAKPSPIANASGGQVNPWKTGNLTQQMLISDQDPELAAVLQREASQ